MSCFSKKAIQQINCIKILTYRVLIEQEEVYENGVNEYEILDSVENIQYPDQICWSLIYRKLGGNRGCTMITDLESNILIVCFTFFSSMISKGFKIKSLAALFLIAPYTEAVSTNLVSQR